MAFGKKRTTGSSPISAAASYEAKTPIEYEYLSYGERDDISKQNVFFDVARFGTRQSAVAFSASAVAPVIESSVVFSASVANANSPILSDDYATIVGTIGNDVINGTAGDDNIQGLGGNDIINGLDGNDVIDGGDGDDRINGGEGNNTLIGGTGFDTAIFDAVLVRGQNRTLTLDGNFTGFELIILEKGIDEIGLGSSAPPAVGAAISYIISLTNANIISGQDLVIVADNLRQNVTTSFGADNRPGGSGINADNISSENLTINASMISGSRNLIIRGGLGNDTLISGAGNDLFQFIGGNDIIDGGAGIDTINFGLIRSNLGVSVNLITGIVSGELTATVKNVENIEGSFRDDIIIGNSLDNNISGQNGDDTINGGEGNDNIDGGLGRDILYGGDGDDTIISGFQDTEFDQIFGGNGNDIISINVNDDADGGTENNVLSIGDGQFQNLSNILIDLSALWLGGFATVGTGRVQNFNSLGGIFLSANTNYVINLGNGSSSGRVNDGGRFNQPPDVRTGSGNDRLIGGNDDNNLSSGDGDDILIGLDGNDILNGGSGINRLEGGNGNDILSGGILSTFIGGPGGDDYRLTSNANPQLAYQIVELAADEGIDIISFFTADGILSDNSFAGIVNIERLQLAASSQTDIFNLGSNFQSTGIRAVDILTPSILNAVDLTSDISIRVNIRFTNSQSIFSGSGNDKIEIFQDLTLTTGSTRIIDGGDGYDTLIPTSLNGNVRGVNPVFSAVILGPPLSSTEGFTNFRNFEKISLAPGLSPVSIDNMPDDRGSTIDYTVNLRDDNISLNSSLLIDGSGLRREVIVQLGADGEIGGTGVNADTLDDEILNLDASNLTGARAVEAIGGEANDIIAGGAGDDSVTGGGGTDTLSGGAGNDVIFGGAGDDILSGGAGNDVIYGDTPTVTSVTAGARASLGASDYAILYQGPSYNLGAIAASNHDLLIIPAARTISFPQAGRNLESLWTSGELDQIKATGKKLVGYLDLAKINDFQVDWQASWTTNGRANGTLTANSPSWLGAYETAAGVENTTIRAANFADPAWRQFLFNRVDTLIGQGFNGIFFDDVGEYFARNVGSIPNIAQAARDMRDLIIDVATHARQTVAALRGTAAADTFSIIINGDPFLITNSTADGSSPNSARNALFYDTVDALLGENYFSIANNSLAVTKAISEFTSRGITLLSADTGGASNLTPQQQQDIIRTAVSAGFLPFTTPSPLYNTLGTRLNPATIPAPIAGNDLLDGGTGADRLLGGVGNDTYVIDDIGDVVTEFAGEGVDIVQSSVDHTLGNNFENLTLTGTTNLNGNGNAANNTINGNAGANAIDGRGGNDTLAGFGGDDVYVVDSAGDIIIETVGGGIDIVFAETSYVLSGAAEVEVFSARSQAETLAINLTGNNFDQLIRGNAGANAIDGRGGNDTLFGFGGNDTFTFLNGFGNDRIGDFDANPDAGQDLLDLRAFGISSASFDNQVTIAQQGLNTFISFGGGSILLAGVNAADITQSDFIL